MRHRLLPFLALLVIAASGCARNPSTGRLQLSLVDDQTINEMGAQAAPGMVEEFGGEITSEPLKQYVRDVGFALAAQVEPEFNDVQWTFTALDSEIINAFALPGGRVYITRGLMERFTNEAQLAGVLGHEIGHVTARHINERVSQSVAAEYGLSVLGALTESELVHAGAGLLAQGTLLSWGRGQESESDNQGLKYMTRAGYDPIGMIEVLEVLMEASEGGRPPEFLATHPYPETRIERTREELLGDYAYTQDNPAYQKYPERYASRALQYLR